MTSLRDINEYLFFEFGCEGHESQISDRWPFPLHLEGSFQEFDGESRVYSFESGDEPFYAIDGARVLDFVAVAGMDLDALRTEAEGRRWVALQNPVDLNTSLGSESGVPSMVQRRKAIEALAEGISGGEGPVQILEGLYLQTRAAYLGLFAVGDTTFLCMDGIAPVQSRFPLASPHRRLSHTIGELLRSGSLHQAGPPKTLDPNES